MLYYKIYAIILYIRKRRYKWTIGKALRKEGIEIVKKIDTLKVNLIAQKIANRLCLAFPEYGFSRAELFTCISRLNMYTAKMSDSLCGAKYYYKDNAIYFNVDFSLLDADIFAIHECLHYLQEVKDEKGNLVRLGLYDFSRNHGMALNEAAVQLMTVNCLNHPTQEVSYYNLNIPSNSIECYPLECAILNQMSYFTGAYPLFYSTIHGNDIFKNTFIALSNKKAFNTIESNLDRMLELENDLAYYFEELKAYENDIIKVRNLNSLMENIKEKITQLFFECQNTIISSCFSKDLQNIHTLSDIKELKDKIYNFKEYIATNTTYTFYNEFYRNLMEELDKKISYIEENGPYMIKDNLVTSISIVSKTNNLFSLIHRIFYKLRFTKQRDF